MANLDDYFTLKNSSSNQPPLFTVFQQRTGRGAAPENPVTRTAYFSSTSSSSTALPQQPQPGDSWPFSSGQNVRGRQQVTKWAETKVTPGAVTSTRTATVSQWVEISSVNGSAQYSQWATQSKTQTASQDSTQLNQQVPALYNSDDFELPVVPLDLTAQLGKGNIGRKGSLGGRRPPTSRSRRNSPSRMPVSLGFPSESANKVGDFSDQESGNNVVSAGREKTMPSAPETIVLETCGPIPKVGKTPPPRPPPPVFRARGGHAGQGEEKIPATFEWQDKEANILHSMAQQEFPDTLKLFFVPAADKTSQTSRGTHINNGDDAKSTSSSSSVPPPLPTTKPPPLPPLVSRVDMVSNERRLSPDTDRILTDVVDIHDKESVEDGEVVRRRTVVTLGPKTNASPNSPKISNALEDGIDHDSGDPEWKRELRLRRSLRSSLPAGDTKPAVAMESNRNSQTGETSGMLGTINITLKSGNSSNSAMNYQGVKREGVSTMFVRASDQDQRPARASAFNVRRTIEQRRNAHQRTNSPSGLGYSTENQHQATPTSAQNHNNASTKSTYLFGECPSLASSSDLSVARTLSISMSLEDLDSSTESSSTQRRGPKKTEAWYERRQSYGFEAAEKFQTSKNKSEANTDLFDSSSGRSTRLSRSWDSLESHNKNGVTNFSELIPPWIRENRPADENPLDVNSQTDIPEPVSQQHQTPTYVFGEHQTDIHKTNISEISESSILDDHRSQESSSTLRRSESAGNRERPRSTANILDDDYEAKEPMWLRDLKMRRSLRESRQCNDESKTSSTAQPPWRNVKLRPTGLRLVSGEVSPTRPVSEPLPEMKSSIFSRPSTPGSTTSTDSRVQKMIERSRRNSRELLSSSPVPPKATGIASVTNPAAKDGTSQTAEEKQSKDSKLLHRKSIELMRLLDDTPYIFSKPEENADPVTGAKTVDIDNESVFTANSEFTENPELGSTGTSLQASAEDLTNPGQRKPKKVGFAHDVKEESDQTSRPRRLRSKSPEARLKEWQAQRDARNAAAAEEAYTTYAKESNLPMTHFGDLQNEFSGVISAEPAVGMPSRPKSEVSEVFRSLLQPRRPYSYPGGNLPVPTPSYPNDPVVPLLPVPLVETKPLHVEPIPESPASPERKIVVVFEENGPLPKSILKKRSLENLLDDRNSTTLETWSQRSVSSVTSSTFHQQRPSYLFSTPNIVGSQTQNASSSNNSGSSPNVPWKVNLKHVDPPLRIKSPDSGESQIEWKAELLRKKASSPPRISCNTPERSAAEPLRPATVFVARCEVSSDVNPFKGQQKKTPKSLTIIEEPVKHDLGYHSLEVETSETKCTEHNYPLRNNQPSPIVNNKNTSIEPQITKIKLRPVGRPRTPEYQEPVNRSPQKFLRKPLSPKLNHKNVVQINSSVPATPEKEPALSRESPVKEMTSKSAIVMSTSAVKDPNEQIAQMAATTKEAEKEAASRKAGDMVEASVNATEVSNNWKFSFTKLEDREKYHPKQYEAKQLELNPRVPSLGNPSSSWRFASTSLNKSNENILVENTSLAEDYSASISENSYDLHEDSPERILTPEPDFAEFKRSLGKLLHKTDRTSEFSSFSNRDTLFSIGSTTETKSVSRKESTVLRTNPSTPKPPERRKSHPLTKSESIAPVENLPQKLKLGMPQDKATLLVRSFFSTSIIDTKKNRFSKTETILEESTPATTPSLTPVTSKMDITQPSDLTITDLSFDSDDQFQLSGTEINSDFGSVLDILNASVDAQDEFTLLKPSEYSSSSARSETSTVKAYSGSERSVRLSDILSQPSTTSSMKSTSITSPMSSRFSTPRGTPDRLFTGSKIPMRMNSPDPNPIPTSSSSKRSSISNIGAPRRSSDTSSTDNLKITSTKVVRRRNSKKSKNGEKPVVSKQARKNSTDSSENEERQATRSRVSSTTVLKKREVSKSVPARPTNVPAVTARKTCVPAEKLPITRRTTPTSKTSSVGPSRTQSNITSMAAKRQALVTASKTSKGSLVTSSNPSPSNLHEGPRNTRTSITSGVSSVTRTTNKVSTGSNSSSNTKRPRAAQTQTRISSQRLGIWV